jgi:hypothetical protein
MHQQNKQHLIKLLSFTPIFLFSFCFGVDTFTQSELKFVKPFYKTDTVIYTSENGQADTIVFNAFTEDTLKLRNLEQGFYNETQLRVRYSLTINSFHKITVKSVNNEPDDFISFGNVKHSHSYKQICFLGLIFDEKYLDEVDVSQLNEITFTQDNATYKNVNINAGIKSFRFDFNKGILSFVDNNNIKWSATSYKQ